MTQDEASPAAKIVRAILFLRGHRVILDADLAALYGVTTKRLNEQVKRNAGRFPENFVFQLTTAEAAATCRMCSPGTPLCRPPTFLTAHVPPR